MPRIVSNPECWNCGTTIRDNNICPDCGEHLEDNPWSPALNWWHNILTDHGRDQFPKPVTNDDIEMYYHNPAEHCTGSLYKAFE